MSYRKLTKSEISFLESNGNCSTDWGKVLVNWTKEESNIFLHYIKNNNFSGKIELGKFQNNITYNGDYSRHCGIYNSSLHNVSVEDNCLIRNVGDCIANYTIGKECVIDNIDSLIVDSESSFGNGVSVCVLNETGGREVIITDYLSSHVAYIMALYRHRPLLHKSLSHLAKTYTKSRTSNKGTIGRNVVIKNCGSIVNVMVGEYAKIDGAERLYNGSVNSNKKAPVTIGYGVIMQDFIVSSGSVIENNAIVNRCFIGQACHLGNGYSAIDSLFFANCHGENGEACSIFAGPFTVTHHKSTLLIAGMFSFMNAGSGSNQSNHMYKLGPIHQGILERGAKTTSDSYILWPSKVGAFSLVMGRHVTHSDTSIFPFSYLIEQNNTTYLSPGVNLRSVGTIRDAQKWPKRDGRTDDNLLDLINYNMLNPYVAQKMIKGLDALNNLLYSSGELSDIYSYHSTKITNRALRKGIKFYNLALTKYFGNLIISRLQVGGAIKPISKFAQVYSTQQEMKKAYEKIKGKSANQKIRIALKKSEGSNDDNWVDICGLFAPKKRILKMISEIERGKYRSIKEINELFAQLHNNYYDLEWDWAYSKIEKYFNISLSSTSKEDMIALIERWKSAVIELDKLIYDDAKKEFSLASMTGFGADGSKAEKERDFEQVRGDFENNKFVVAVLEHIQKKGSLGEAVIKELKLM